MRAFCFACAIAVAMTVALTLVFPFKTPQPLPRQEATEGLAQIAAESAAERAAAKPVEAAAREAAEKRETPQRQTAVPSESEQSVAADQQRVAASYDAIEDTFPDSMPLKPDLSYLADYVYSEVPPDIRPADTVLEALKGIPSGAPIDEVDLAATALGLDAGFMKAVARIESGFDPKQRTGSYIGLFQLSNYEFNKYGSGEITDARDNAVAASYKFVTAAILFEISTHRKPTLSDLYLIHQQGTQGAAEHVNHPDWIAWKSMCATDEGHVKGEKWCKRAIWQNTLPAIKAIWKSVDNLTSAAFVEMWRQRIDLFYARYSQALAQK